MYVGATKLPVNVVKHLGKKRPFCKKDLIRTANLICENYVLPLNVSCFDADEAMASCVCLHISSDTVSLSFFGYTITVALLLIRTRSPS